MSQIILNEMSYSYKTYYEPIFENVNLALNTNWKLGLIGRNGRGKTTLLKLIHGELTPDAGKIIKDIHTEMFPYENKATYPYTLDVIKENIGGLRAMEDNLEDLDTLQRYIDLDGFEIESQIKKEMYRMSLSEDLLYQEYALLSGGEKMKVLMIALFLRRRSFILLDEPTNHLDIEGKQTVAKYLSKKKGFIVISHDRAFLDQIIDHVVSINKVGISVEKGNYTTWKKNKDLKDEYELRTMDKLEREINSLERSSATSRRRAGIAETQKYAFACHARANGSKAFMRQAKHSEERIKNHIEEKKSLLLNYEKAKTLELHQDQIEDDCLLFANHLSFGYSDKPLIDDLSLKIYPGDAVWIRGKNGSGKSTLLYLLSQKISNTTVNYGEGVHLSEAYQEPLWNDGFIEDLFPTENEEDKNIFEKFKDLCHIFDLPEGYLERPIETYSSGEKKKVDIARALSVNSHILFLDEPLNYMDLFFRQQLEKAILKYKPTVVFVEHDKRFGETISNVVIDL